MRSTFSGIEIAKRSLFAQQTALNTTGHNIANANTQGYTRQVVNLVASKPMEAVGLMRSNTPGQIGQGVEFDAIRRVRERFLDHQFYEENNSYGDWTVRKDVLEKLEAIFNEPSDTGVRQVIEKFWNAWQVFSKEPENPTARAALKETALAMTDTFNHTSQQLTNLKTDLTENLNVKAREANSILDQVARLNNEIFRVEGLGNDANDLRDQRDLLVDQLSGIVNIQLSEDQGGYNLKMGNIDLVRGIEVLTIFDSGDSTVGTGNVIKFEDAMASNDLTEGEAHGLIVSRDTNLTNYQYQLNAMIKSMVEGEVTLTLPAGSVLPPNLPKGATYNGKVYTGTETIPDTQRVLNADTKITVKGLNGIHMLGYTLDTPPKSGIPFFTLREGEIEYNAWSIQVNPDIVGKVSNITASSRVETDSSGNIVKDASGNEIAVKGNNAIALAIAGLRNQRMDFDPNPSEPGQPLLNFGTFDEFYRAIVGQLGVQTQEADRQATNQKVLVDQIDGRRQSVSGVSMDEEMANMMKFQHAYNAAARMMTTFDEMLDKVINGMGTVGR